MSERVHLNYFVEILTAVLEQLLTVLRTLNSLPTDDFAMWRRSSGGRLRPLASPTLSPHVRQILDSGRLVTSHWVDPLVQIW